MRGYIAAITEEEHIFVVIVSTYWTSLRFRLIIKVINYHVRVNIGDLDPVLNRVG